MFIRKNTDKWIMYILVDSITGARKTGLTYTDVSCTYKKEGYAYEITKTLDANNFREIGNGKYEILFTSSELDTVGVFHSEVTGASIEPSTREDYIISPVRGTSTFWENIT